MSWNKDETIWKAEILLQVRKTLIECCEDVYVKSTTSFDAFLTGSNLVSYLNGLQREVLNELNKMSDIEKDKAKLNLPNCFDELCEMVWKS